jgi:hypothetical protein
MAQTQILIEFDEASGEVTRIFHFEQDHMYEGVQAEPGRGKVLAPRDQFPIKDGKPDYGLEECREFVRKRRGG